MKMHMPTVPKTPKRLIYFAGNIMFLCGWIVTLVGLSLAQKECEDIVEDSLNGTINLDGDFFARPAGSDCDDTFRFFWWTFLLNIIPLVLAIFAIISPEVVRGAATSFFAVVAPLNMLMANSFYDAFDDHEIEDDLEDGLKVGMSGFCIMAGAALLMLLMDALLISETNTNKTSTAVHAPVAAQPKREGTAAPVAGIEAAQAV